MEQAIVSVIMPVYNAEKYLAEALNGIVNQTLKNIEIICVDDGSTDASAEILCDFAKRDGRIAVITQENRGAGAARNAGLAIARGEYLSFLDADDLFEPEMLRVAYAEAKRFDADIVVFDAEIFDSNTGRQLDASHILRSSLIPAGKAFSPADNCDNIFTFTFNVAWNKLYRTDTIRRHKLRFQEIKSSNDLLFVCAAFVEAQRIRCVNRKLLRYRKNTGNQLSEKHTITEKNWNMLDALLAVFTYIKPHRLYDKVAQNFVDWSISYLLSDLRIKRKLYDEAFKALIFEFWLPLIGCKPRSFESHMNFLIFNEWMEPGFIAGFFKTPYIASPISFVLPSLRIARDSDVILYGAGAAGVELYLQIKQSGIYNIVTWVDNQAGSQSKQGFPVELPIVISKIDFDFILIALINSAQVAEINDTLINMNVPVTKIIRVFA